ncbi:MAG TPA: FxLYD domain-containing protein [Acidimicrobiia bacterium]|jgi:hypothetical protein|nr:FxLYD domain-containing protein [Acidimicrobiia bacterium]
MRRTTFVLCVLVTLVACAACSSSSAKKDVSITSCKADPGGGHPTVAGTIHNHSSKASTYAIHVKFDDASGNGVGDGVSAVGRVDSGGNAHWDATGSEDAKGPVKCSLDSVTRTVAP